VSVNTHKGFALEILMTMVHILDKGVPSFSFRLDGVEQVVPYDIRNYLVFKGEPQNKWMCMEAHWKFFLEYDHGRRPSTKKHYPKPHRPSVSLMDVQKDFGENERNKGNRHGVELALLGFDCQAINRPLSPSGCYLSMLAISLRPLF
jgi:hypothetical protein